MVVETAKEECVLLKCIESKNEHQFQYILDEQRINPNKKLKCFDGLSTFEYILKTPYMRPFIEVCLNDWCDFFKKNSDGKYPLHYAIDSMCADNLMAILKSTQDRFSGPSKDAFLSTQYSMIINEKFDGGNNYLHLLCNSITDENYPDLSTMITALVLNGCNINAPNEKNETPFYLMLNSPIVDADLISFIIDNTKVDFHSHNGNTIGAMMEERGLGHCVTSRPSDFVVNTNYMIEHLGNWSEWQLTENLKLWKANSKNFDNEIIDLMEVAILKNLSETVSILMDVGIEINGISKNSKFKMTPAFLACTFGYHRVLNVLLSDKNLSFRSSNLKRNLLHQIFASQIIDAEDRQKTFDLLISDERCTLGIINQTDAEDQVPLFYACKYECDDIVRELLKRGAYIGHVSVINYIKRDTFEEFLNECVKPSCEISDRECEVYFDYKFLMPPDRKKLEITSIHLIYASANLNELILHPLITSFVLLKWRKIELVVYFNLLVYFSFLLFLGSILVSFYHVAGDTKAFQSDYELQNDICEGSIRYDNELFNFSADSLTFPEKEEYMETHATAEWLYANFDLVKSLFDTKSLGIEQRFEQSDDFWEEVKFGERYKKYFARHLVSYWFGMFGLILMTIHEIVQCVMSFKKYFFKPINWLDISLIAFSFCVFKNLGLGRAHFQQICAIMILLMGAQCIQLLSKVSAFSLSLHMAILNKVSATFFKTTAPYLIIISSFGMSFFALNYDISRGITSEAAEHTVALNAGFSNPFLSTISTVRMMLADFGAVTIGNEDYFQGLLFLAFVICITVILLNLLNALAISDTNEMKLNAEFVELKTRIGTLRNYETLYSFFNVTYANVFPKITTIMLTPNKDKFIKFKQRFLSSDNVTIVDMRKSSDIPQKFDYLYADWKFFGKQSRLVKLNEKLLKKIVVFVKNQQENENLKDKDDTMSHTIRTAQDDIFEKLTKLSDQHQMLQKEFAKISNSLDSKPESNGEK